MVHRPSEPEQIFAVYWMPRDSPAGLRFLSFAEEFERGKRLPGVLPIEDALLYGERSLLVIAHFQLEEKNGSGNLKKALERLTCAFEALASAHSRGISINFWPVRGFMMHETSFICSYAFESDDETVADWPAPGVGTVSHEAKYAPIAGRRFPRRIVARFPPAPAKGESTPIYSSYQCPSRPRPWTQRMAADYPLVPGPKLVSRCYQNISSRAERSAAQFLWNLLWSSTDDRCDRAYPTGERDTFDWEDTLYAQSWLPSDCFGLFHEIPWECLTPGEESSPEQAALHEDNILWWELTTPLPFDRFKRDVFELTSRLSRSVDWYAYRKKPSREHFQDETDSVVSEVGRGKIWWGLTLCLLCSNTRKSS